MKTSRPTMVWAVVGSSASGSALSAMVRVPPLFTLDDPEGWLALPPPHAANTNSDPRTRADLLTISFSLLEGDDTPCCFLPAPNVRARGPLAGSRSPARTEPPPPRLPAASAPDRR